MRVEQSRTPWHVDRCRRTPIIIGMYVYYLLLFLRPLGPSAVFFLRSPLFKTRAYLYYTYIQTCIVLHSVRKRRYCKKIIKKKPHVLLLLVDRVPDRTPTHSCARTKNRRGHSILPHRRMAGYENCATIRRDDNARTRRVGVFIFIIIVYKQIEKCKTKTNFQKKFLYSIISSTVRLPPTTGLCTTAVSL